MYIVAWTKNWSFVDEYSVHETLELAQQEYQRIVNGELEKGEECYCAAIAKIVQGTEPQWLDEEDKGYIPVEE